MLFICMMVTCSLTCGKTTCILDPPSSKTYNLFACRSLITFEQKLTDYSVLRRFQVVAENNYGRGPIGVKKFTVQNGKCSN